MVGRSTRPSVVLVHDAVPSEIPVWILHVSGISVMHQSKFAFLIKLRTEEFYSGPTEDHCRVRVFLARLVHNPLHWLPF